jgi:hypothetical protein
MKERLTTGWTFQRVIYLILGSFILIQSLVELHWMGILFGSYFASMGLFAFGCASGNCFGSTCETPGSKQNSIDKVEFEEVKSK